MCRWSPLTRSDRLGGKSGDGTRLQPAGATEPGTSAVALSSASASDSATAATISRTRSGSRSINSLRTVSTLLSRGSDRGIASIEEIRLAWEAAQASQGRWLIGTNECAEARRVTALLGDE